MQSPTSPPEYLLADAGNSMEEAGSALAYLEALIGLLRAAGEATHQPADLDLFDFVLLLEPLNMKLSVAADGADAVFKQLVHQRDIGAAVN